MPRTISSKRNAHVKFFENTFAHLVRGISFRLWLNSVCVTIRILRNRTMLTFAMYFRDILINSKF